MRCFNCGSEIADDSVFCEYCGTPIVKPETPSNERKRHYFITFWLICMIVFNIYNGIEGTIIIPFKSKWNIGMTLIFFVTSLLDLLVAYGAFRLFKWKKIGFWLILSAMCIGLLSSICIAVVYALEFFVALIPSVALMIATAVLYGSLFLKRNGKTCWSQLE